MRIMLRLPTRGYPRTVNMLSSTCIFSFIVACFLEIPLWKVNGAAVGGSNCVISSPYQSRYIRAYMEHDVPSVRSCVSNSTTAAGQEIHVVNLKQISKSTESQPQEVSVTVKTYHQRGKYRKPLVIVLRSDLPTTWRLETVKIRDATPIRHIFVISKHSTILFHNFSLRQTVQNVEGLPGESHALLQWVESKYGQLSAFAELSGVNALVLQVGIHKEPDLPLLCQLEKGNSDLSSIRGAYREGRSITGCASEGFAQNTKSVHIIEVSGDLNRRGAEIVIEIVPEIFGSVNSDMVLFLKSPNDLNWKVKSRKVHGSIEIVGNSHMDTEEVNMDTVETRLEELLYSGKELVSWVEYRYGPVVSYSGVPDSNHILLLVPKQDQHSDTKPSKELPPYLSQAVGAKSSPFKNPSQTEFAVRSAMVTECDTTGLEMSLPRSVAKIYGIQEKYLSLRNPACRAHVNSTHFIIKSSLSGCHMQISEREREVTYSNALVIKAITRTEKRGTDEDQLITGSGDGTEDDAEFSGSGAGEFVEGDNSAITHLDDEDYQIQSLEIGIQCSLNRDRKSQEHMYFLDVFSGPMYKSFEEYPVVVTRGQTIYMQASVQAESGTHLLLEECWLVSETDGRRLLEVVTHGCLVQSGSKWHASQSGNDVLSSSGTLRFSFPLPKDFNTKRFAIGCLAMPCSQSGVRTNHILRQCVDQEQYCVKQRSVVANPADKALMTIMQGAGGFQLHFEPYFNDYEPGKLPKPGQGATLPANNKPNEEMPAGKIIMEGLDSGTVIGIAFAAFVIGVMLTAALWYIHAHTGPVKQAGNGRGWAESSGETTPCSTAPIHITT